MIQLNRGESSEKIIVTLSELKTLNEPNYLFIFTHTTTKQVVKKVFLNSSDESEYQSRYNKFTIQTSSVFNNKASGEWTYRVYEQESETNEDPELSTSLIEAGKMILLKPESDQLTYKKPSQTITYKVNNQ